MSVQSAPVSAPNRNICNLLGCVAPPPPSSALGFVSCVFDVKRLPLQDPATAVTRHSDVGSAPQRSGGSGCRRKPWYLYRGMLCFDIVYCCGMLSAFRRNRGHVNYFDVNLNPIASSLKTEAVCYAEKSVSAYSTTRCQYTEERTLKNVYRQNQETKIDFVLFIDL